MPYASLLLHLYREWPDHFPPGCPGATTPDASGSAFRLVNDTEQDWKSKTELGEFPGADECERASLSVWNTLDHATSALKTLTRYSAIARADLEPIHGKMAKTGKKQGHYSLWLRRIHHAACASLFMRIEP